MKELHEAWDAYRAANMASDRHGGVVARCLRSIRRGPRAVEVIVWSAGIRAHVDRCLRLIDPDGTLVDHAVCRGESWLPRTPQPGTPWTLTGVALKDLSVLPGRASTSVLVDDSPYVSVRSGGRAIVVPAFHPDSGSQNDTTLLYVLQVVTYLALVLGVERMDRAVEAPPDAIEAIARSDAHWARLSHATSSIDGTEAETESVTAQATPSVGTQEPLEASIEAETAQETLGASIERETDQERPEPAIESSVSRVDSDKPARLDVAIRRAARFLRAERAAPGARLTREALAMSSSTECGAAIGAARVVARVLRSPDPVTPTATDNERLSIVGALDESPFARALRAHPFIVRRSLPTPHGSVFACALDVVDPLRFGPAIAAFLQEYSPVDQGASA
jgi:hypothetical protein